MEQAQSNPTRATTNEAGLWLPLRIHFVSNRARTTSGNDRIAAGL
jgi:hypothetical protein